MYMTSLIALAKLCPSMPMILKFSTGVVWPVLLWCSKIGDYALKCFLYLSANILDDSPMYSSSVNPDTPKPINHTALLCFVMVSLSFGDTNKFLRGIHPLKCTCTPYLWQMFLKLSLVPCVYETTIWHVFLMDVGICLFLVVLFG